MDIVHSIKQELNETRGILIKSYEKLLDQSKKLDELEAKTNEISHQSNIFKQKAMPQGWFSKYRSFIVTSGVTVAAWFLLF